MTAALPFPSPAPRVSATLAATDYFRRSPARLRGRADHKEWQHFLVHTEGAHLLVNFNLVDDRWAPDPRRAEVARLIALARTDAWDGGVDRFADGEVEVVSGRIDARFGESWLRFDRGRYLLSIALRDRPLAAELELVPTTTPALSANQPLSPERSLSWLFVPRLVARGTITAGGVTRRVEAAPAYHDHNWGHFLWGDDFSWEWGSALPWDPANAWSVVHVRMTDRGRSAARYQGLFLWREGEPLRVFRDEEIRVAYDGCFDVGRPLRVPRVMALLAPGLASDVPRRMEVVARGDGDELRLRFAPDAVAQVVMPSERELEAVTVLNEVSGRAALSGRVRGVEVAMEGPGVFEFLRDG
ncbi:hypothetical protein WMF20_01520 [Sorangium sp. So ce834]|uniref:hypothetical protein n=1 Tax=Sorangium sp. So ce834 TaxID=3133321 RepID=UPI003F6028BB